MMLYNTGLKAIIKQPPCPEQVADTGYGRKNRLGHKGNPTLVFYNPFKTKTKNGDDINDLRDFILIIMISICGSREK